MWAKVNEYKTAKGDSADSLDKAVNLLIADGFQPYQQPYVIGSGVAVLWICQAMIKPAEGASLSGMMSNFIK